MSVKYLWYVCACTYMCSLSPSPSPPPSPLCHSLFLTLSSDCKPSPLAAAVCYLQSYTWRYGSLSSLTVGPHFTGTAAVSKLPTVIHRHVFITRLLHVYMYLHVISLSLSLSLADCRPSVYLYSCCFQANYSHTCILTSRHH